METKTRLIVDHIKPIRGTDYYWYAIDTTEDFIHELIDERWWELEFSRDHWAKGLEEKGEPSFKKGTIIQIACSNFKDHSSDGRDFTEISGSIFKQWINSQGA